MKPGWIVDKLGSVSELIARGIAPSYTLDGGVRVLNQKCIRDHRIDYNLARRNDATTKRVPADRLIRLGDVMVNSTGTGTLGRVAQVRAEPDEATTVDTHVTIVRPKPELFDLAFFGYMLVKIEDQLIEGGMGASGQTELPRSDLQSKFEVTYPSSIDEQRRIVAILDEAFEGLSRARANTEANLADARGLFERHLKETFAAHQNNEPRKTVGDAIVLQRGTDITKSQQGSGQVPVVSSGGIRSYHNEAIAKGPGVVVGRKGSIGSVYFVESDFWPHDTTLWVKDFKGNDPKLVFYLLSALDLKGLDTGAANPSLNRNLVHPIPITWPDLTEQDSLVHRIESLESAIDALKVGYREQLADLDTLRQSLLQKAFAGELT